jgi:hypothetical protein
MLDRKGWKTDILLTCMFINQFLISFLFFVFCLNLFISFFLCGYGNGLIDQFPHNSLTHFLILYLLNAFSLFYKHFYLYVTKRLRRGWG